MTIRNLQFSSNNRPFMYVLTLLLIIGCTIYLALFSGLCKQLQARCTKDDSMDSKLALSGIGVSIGMLIAVVYSMLKPLICSAPYGMGTIFMLIVMAGILGLGAVIAMNINDKVVDGQPMSDINKLKSILYNNILFLTIGVGIIYSVLMNFVGVSGLSPLTVLSITLIPICGFAIYLGVKTMELYDQNKNESGVCDKYPASDKVDLSGIAKIVGPDPSSTPEKAKETVKWMTIGAGIFIALCLVRVVLSIVFARKKTATPAK